ncbi:unnamed protein product [Paramecium primaurelia]|uniref:LITAF domain-containing protein n=1 Tax=Paramecium primaurelia TaxID=5886 RepID=A0A8S1M762_PARPR|nr:unnamed protein product [Paramecium primaurelia]
MDQAITNKPYRAMDPQVLDQNQVSAEGQSKPTLIKCFKCGWLGVTKVKNKIGKATLCASLLLLVLFCPLFWLPCCLKSCQDKVHFCQSCGIIVGAKLYKLC